MKHKEFNPFLFYSAQLQDMLLKAKKQSNPALWLYKNNVRTTLFMLEALTRLHNKAFDEKLFSKWNKRFKKLEDLFGELDQFIVLENQLKKNKKVSKEILKYFSVHSTNILNKCNRRLTEKEWFNNKLESFDNKLSEFDVEYNQEYLNELKYVVEDEVDSIYLFCEKVNFQFTKLEEEVHELRRKLRWLSIYAQALNGLIQLKKIKSNAKYKINYFNKEILNSPYNQLPKKPKNTIIIEYNSEAFFALSWIINELGKLKDNGINLQMLSDAIYIAENLNRVEAEEKSISLLALHKGVNEEILRNASDIMKTYLTEDKLLDALII
ncbi:MAG TPA: hypothetical protein PKZ75_12670 [Bacteroidia bacterium]|nr:hypothetical protein [Bacteroidia bacterium]